MSVQFQPLDARSLFATAIEPKTVTATETGPSVELPDGDGPVYALVQVGDYDEQSELTVAFQESDDGSTWTSVSGGSAPGLAPNGLVLHSFQRTKRYLRCQATVTGADTDATLAVLVGQAYKLF